MNPKTIAIIGLGLIGGSLAKAIRAKKLNYSITGIDSNLHSLELACTEGIIDRMDLSIKGGVKDADIIFICSPVGSALKIFKEVVAHGKKGAIITDVCSTKEEIVHLSQNYPSEDYYFIGGHPMAGTENSGFSHSMPHLFENAYYILTPSPDIPEMIKDELLSLIKSIGAIPIVMDPSQHDNIVGAISHLPHIIAAALVNTVRDVDDPDKFKERLAAGGFKDITRIASSNPAMWRDISLSNRKHILSLLSSAIHHLNHFRCFIEENNVQKIENFFVKARDFRQTLPDFQSLTLLPYRELYVDVQDRPGIIGEVTTILGREQINIKNIRIINSREDEPGCLVLSFTDPMSIDAAAKILSSNGFKTYKQ